MSPLPSWLRLPHADGPILVRIAPNSSSSSRRLDLDLTATDDEQAFVLILRHSDISRYRDKRSSLSDSEWESCLTYLLLGGQPSEQFSAAARFDDGNLAIDVRSKISGTTQIAGTLVLKPSKSATANIDVFDWANEAVLRQTQTAAEFAQLQRKHAELEKVVTEEMAHIKMLERSKYEFESEHGAFFRDLLNEKKLKIRTQEQILSTASVDDAKVAALSAKASKSPAAPRHPNAVGSSRKGKRKAVTASDSTDDDFDKMEIDEQLESADQELSTVDQTTEDEETASEPDPEANSPPKRKKPTGATGSIKAKKPNNKPPRPNLRGKSPAVAAQNEDEDMPPPRILPFGTKAKRVPEPADDESTASEN